MSIELSHYWKCESPAENILLDMLSKTGLQIEQQVSIGRYRIDAVTGCESFAYKSRDDDVFITAGDCARLALNDIILRQNSAFKPTVGWEVDGKKWHDEERDRHRDNWILRNSDIRIIVRIPAAAIMFFRDACMAGLSKFMSSFERFGRFCCDAEQVAVEADSMSEGIDNGQYGSWIADDLASGECFKVVGDEILVGSPIAFLPENHQLLSHVSNRNLNRWVGRISVRSVA